MFKITLVIQARMGSTRLPGKSTMDLAGKPMLEQIINRLKRCRNIDGIVLAIPDTKQNLVLSDIGKRCGVDVFSGSEENLVARFYGAVSKFGGNQIVRFPADNPVPEPSVIDQLIDYHLGHNALGFSTNITNVWGSGHPDGIGAEVFNVELLREIQKFKLGKERSEHVHLNFFDYDTGLPRDTSWCQVAVPPCPNTIKRPDLILDVNTRGQYEFMRELYGALYPLNEHFTIEDIINWADNRKMTNGHK